MNNKYKNGITPYPAQQVLRLSDSFEKPEIFGIKEKEAVALELVLKVININAGMNKKIAGRCRKLAEYSAFVAKVRFYEQEMENKEAAFKAAIKYCREHDILSEFLELHSTEVFNMLLTEWNTEDARVVWYEEGLEEGLQKGLQQGRQEGLLKGKQEIIALLKSGKSPEEIIADNN